MSQLNQADDLIQTTHATISIHVDRASAVLRMWSEPEPHRTDWSEARRIIKRLTDGIVFDSYAEGSLDVFEMRLAA